MLEVDPQVAELLSMVPFGTIDSSILNTMRSVQLGAPPVLSDAVERREHVVPGDPEVLIRVHRPAGVEGDMPCLYSIHGGGFVLGSYDMDDARFDALVPEVLMCRRLRAISPRP